MLATLLLVATASVALAAQAPEKSFAADLSKFDPGLIISDALFYKGDAMNASEVQSFLNSRFTNCRSGYTCLRDYSQQTADRAGDSRCSAYRSPGIETSAQIIAHVGSVCNISQKALIVLLQKEQGLITSTGPSSTAYRSATGFGCPDTAACDSTYYGFFNQVYSAARQFQVYRTSPTSFRHQAGRVNSVLFHPNASCGSAPVFIQNAATAGLYNYTPYQPNAAALAAGYGVGDACSTYGNRNFFSYYTDWFGSTAFQVQGSIGDFWRSAGGSGSYLGEPIGAEVQSSGGWWQDFAGGSLYVLPGQPVIAVKGEIGRVFNLRNGGGIGALGWPIISEQTVGGGWLQRFQNGAIYCSRYGTFAVSEPTASYLVRRGDVTGTLGWPTASAASSAAGSIQTFERGTVYGSPAGAFEIASDLTGAYSNAGGPSGLLGFPTSEPVPSSGGSVQAFNGGALAANGNSPLLVSGSIGVAYLSSGGASSQLGAPVASMRSYADGWSQLFAGGEIFASAAGTYQLLGAEADAYRASGGPLGALGWPRGPAESKAGGSVRQFDHGLITVGGGGDAHLVQGSIAGVYTRRGGADSYLALPLGDEEGVGGGWEQQFQRGGIYVSQAGGFAVQGALGSAYRDAGASNGFLGWPIADESPLVGGYGQRFVGGDVFSSAAGAFAVSGAVRGYYNSLGATKGPLGFPQASLSNRPGGWAQEFSGGVIYVEQGAAAHSVRGWLSQLYAGLGASQSGLGWPTGDERLLPGGYAQSFRQGALYSSARGAFWSGGAIDARYASLGGPSSRLGWPTGSLTASASGWSQAYEGGSILADRAGAVSVTTR